MDIDPEKVLRSPYIAGALGALLALKSTPGDTWPTRLFNVLAGALIAGFISPAVCEFFSLESPAMQGAMAFASGLFGMNVIAMVVGWTKTLQLSDFLPWIKGK
jgi:hypothetical protein